MWKSILSEIYELFYAGRGRELFYIGFLMMEWISLLGTSIDSQSYSFEKVLRKLIRNEMPTYFWDDVRVGHIF